MHFVLVLDWVHIVTFIDGRIQKADVSQKRFLRKKLVHLVVFVRNCFYSSDELHKTTFWTLGFH